MKNLFLLITFFSITCPIFAQEESNMDTLKHGHYLYFQKGNGNDYVYLNEGNSWKKILSYNPLSFYKPWVGMEDHNYLVLTTMSNRPQSPQNFYFYSKSTGDSLFSITGFILKTDTVNNIFVFDDKGAHNTSFVVYSLNNNKIELYARPNDNPCYCCSSNT